MTVAGRTTVSGDELVRVLQRLIAYGKQIQVVERRGQPARHRREAAGARHPRQGALRGSREPRRLRARRSRPRAEPSTIVADEEHNLFQLQVEDRASGYPRRYTVTAEFLATGPYRTLLNIYRDVAEYLAGPFVVTSGAAAPTTRSPSRARRLPPAPAARARDESVTLQSVDALVEYFIAAGKKGVAINRYKGLGEMNPDQLWATTMKPEERTLLQVKAEDHAEADLMFTTLMGDQVEPRRKFIEDNALDVKNLDV